jgi:hypothetical protein
LVRNPGLKRLGFQLRLTEITGETTALEKQGVFWG